MIQPNELRIGNYIEWSNHDDYSEIKAITGKDIEEIEYNHMHPEDLEERNRVHSSWDYIPITPEILERLGFEKCESDDIDERQIYSIQVENNHSLYFDPTEDPKWYISLQWNNNHYKNSFWFQPEFVHELQNLYHSLTRQELTFKTN
jgi:hypothetical protein